MRTIESCVRAAMGAPCWAAQQNPNRSTATECLNMSIDIVTVGLPLATSLAGLLSALAALRTARASRATAEAAGAQAAAALGQAAAAQAQADARAEEIRLIRATLHRELARDSRAAIESDHAIANKVSDVIWAGAGSADQAARLGNTPHADPQVEAFLAALRDLFRSHASQLAIVLGLSSPEWAGLQHASAMLRSIEFGGTWLGYDELNQTHGGFLSLLLASERKIYARLAEHEEFLRAPIEPPTD
ncbi:MAG: hypothetical protein ACYC7F_13560, partial [Gemmatimonadaceae bacterium]